MLGRRPTKVDFSQMTVYPRLNGLVPSASQRP
jgi:hypothetical protein